MRTILQASNYQQTGDPLVAAEIQHITNVLIEQQMKSVFQLLFRSIQNQIIDSQPGGK